MFTAKKIKKMDEELSFIIGYRNLFNLILLFVSAALFLLAAGNGFVVVIGVVLFVLGLARFYDQAMKNVDDLEIRALEKKDG
jgi:hypothetical protein